MANDWEFMAFGIQSNDEFTSNWARLALEWHSTCHTNNTLFITLALSMRILFSLFSIAHSPRPIFSIKYIEWHGDIPNILYTSITNVGNVLQCAGWEGRIAWIITIHKIHIVISRWLCGFRLTVCRRERPLLHLWGATFDGEKDERSCGKEIKQRKRNEFKAVNWEGSTISCQQAFPVVVDCSGYYISCAWVSHSHH